MNLTATAPPTISTTGSPCASATGPTISATGSSSPSATGPTALLEPEVAAATADEEERGTRYARCADGHGTLSHLFFSDDDLDIARAKAICASCGLRETCLAGAIERAEPFGVWGGKLMLDGVPVDVKRRRGRPPKHPRPVLVVDEVPIPPHLVA